MRPSQSITLTCAIRCIRLFSHKYLSYKRMEGSIGIPCFCNLAIPALFKFRCMRITGDMRHALNSELSTAAANVNVHLPTRCPQTLATVPDDGLLLPPAHVFPLSCIITMASHFLSHCQCALVFQPPDLSLITRRPFPRRISVSCHLTAALSARVNLFTYVLFVFAEITLDCICTWLLLHIKHHSIGEEWWLYFFFF